MSDPTKKTTCLTIHRARVWVMRTGTRAIREGKDEDSDDFLIRTKAPLWAIVSLYARPQRAARAVPEPKTTHSPVGSVLLSAAPAPAMSSDTISHKVTVVDFSRTTSPNSTTKTGSTRLRFPQPDSSPHSPHPSLNPSRLAARRAVSVRRRASMPRFRRARWRTCKRTDPSAYC
ncbi:hypothetical protein EI94DRAFT_869448 [Lactarius quietus]|nr:hypothetical protein EI94DRAFT_869448 [Lactarius quietus]